MDYNRFMQKIDKQIHKMDEQTLRSWIRNYARKLPENSRTQFLERFYTSETEDKQTLLARLQNVEEWIASIHSLKVFIYLILNEYYDDWHDEPEDEFIDVKDPLDVFERFKDACQLAENLMEKKCIRKRMSC